MSWSSTTPTVPGRYYYRDHEYGEYGICLVAWDEGHDYGSTGTRPPTLAIRTLCIFGRQKHLYMGENSRSPGWSYSSYGSQDIEIWHEPISGCPPGFPEVRTEKPPDIPTGRKESK